jgi:hypothetical protein
VLVTKFFKRNRVWVAPGNSACKRLNKLCPLLSAHNKRRSVPYNKQGNWRVKAFVALDKRNVASQVKSVVLNRRNNWQRSVLDSPRGRLKGS